MPKKRKFVVKIFLKILFWPSFFINLPFAPKFCQNGVFIVIWELNCGGLILFSSEMTR